ncbi:hypothetical protein [Alicyclobacillus sp. SO9]|uniref:hypothetical protein n=1 Tax=Alicyclobacillus sp. SO9 TaxID=2665646 RepID=UPI0018E8E44B|nr:hypothetical protein [Alicyclobacillus sp. SO9]QQE77653.1 hypothetical protein GI364_17180 [Alicyclobacillus sp. SO9]
MVGGLIQLQQRLQEAESLIQNLEDELQTLIDEENGPGKNNQSEPSNSRPSGRDTQEAGDLEQSGLYSYGSQYADVRSSGTYGASAAAKSFAQNSIAQTRYSSLCIGREGASAAYTRPV